MTRSAAHPFSEETVDSFSAEAHVAARIVALMADQQPESMRGAFLAAVFAKVRAMEERRGAMAPGSPGGEAARNR